MNIGASAEIAYELSAEGFRMTPLRRTILAIVTENTKPFSLEDIRTSLKERATPFHLASLYRELDILTEADVLRPIYFHDHVKRYEFVQRQHHHHIVCTECKSIEDIHLDCDFERQESTIAQKTHFSSLRHSLEFFGLCKKCSSVSR